VIQELQKNDNEMPIFIKWVDFVEWLLLTTDRFPKKARFTFTDRLVGLSLSIIEDLVEARYTRNKAVPLRHANLTLEKLRVVLRVCYEAQILSKDGYKHASFKLNEVGKMLGGWIKQQGGQ